MGADPIPAVPSYRLTLPHVGDSLTDARPFRLSLAPIRTVPFATDIIEESTEPTVRPPVSFAPSPPPPDPFARLPLRQVAGTTVFDLGGVGIGGAALGAGDLQGIGGGLSLRVNDLGDGALFWNVLGTPLGSFAVINPFSLSGSR